MAVGEGVVDGHVLEVPFHVHVEEALDFAVVERGVHEDGADVGLDDIGETLL